jgi:K+-sensing histidine kinase KdpD
MSFSVLVPQLLPNHQKSHPARPGPPHAVNKPGRRIDWSLKNISPVREYIEVLGVIGAVTLGGWFLPLSYEAFGHIYLLVVILLCLRVGRGPVLFAAIVSAVAWNYVFIPPRLSFSVIDFDDSILLGVYFVVALIAGQLTARIRAQERHERLREQRATALFHLTRALAGAHTLDEAVEAALCQADELFNARTALLLIGTKGALEPHAAGSLTLTDEERTMAEQAWRQGREAGRFTDLSASAGALYLPMLRAGAVLGVFVLQLPAGIARATPEQRELIEGFAAQIALLVEREQLRAASEREKFFAESDRLHRTLLDSVSHELKTPLAVLRAAGEKLDTEDARKRAGLTAEVRTATSRLDHLVANLLNQTRLEAGGVRPQPDWCDARDIIHAARRAIGEALAGRPFKTDIPDDLPLCLADAPLMEQVIANLLLNAALHTPAGSPIHVTAGLDHAGGAGRIFIRISDRGPGLPAELRENLFQKFRRGHAARAGGLGLGLSIVRGFMLAQGGEVVAGDNPGGGAAFTVYLPHVLHGNVPNDER